MVSRHGKAAHMAGKGTAVAVVKPVFRREISALSVKGHDHGGDGVRLEVCGDIEQTGIPAIAHALGDGGLVQTGN